jgi:hypothetical protein
MADNARVSGLTRGEVVLTLTSASSGISEECALYLKTWHSQWGREAFGWLADELRREHVFTLHLAAG